MTRNLNRGNISFYDKKPKQQGYQQQATPQNNIDDPNRHNVGGNMNRPSQQQVPGTQIPLEVQDGNIPF